MALTPKEKQEMLETNATQMLDQCDTVTLASINEDGHTAYSGLRLSVQLFGLIIFLELINIRDSFS